MDNAEKKKLRLELRAEVLRLLTVDGNDLAAEGISGAICSRAVAGVSPELLTTCVAYEDALRLVLATCREPA